MNRKEILAYVLTAILGGLVAGQIGGLLGVLGVFAGVSVIGYADLVVSLRGT